MHLCIVLKCSFLLRKKILEHSLSTLFLIARLRIRCHLHVDIKVLLVTYNFSLERTCIFGSGS